MCHVNYSHLTLNNQNRKDLIIINSLKNTIEDSTRQQALLDPIMVPNDMLYSDSGTIETLSFISDQRATYIIIPFNYHVNFLLKG